MNGYKWLLFGVLMQTCFVCSSSAFGSAFTGAELKHGNILEFASVFVLGMSFSLIILAWFSKPIIAYSSRYIVLLTLVLGIQLYALANVLNLPSIVLLISSAIFLVCSYFYTTTSILYLTHIKRFNGIVAILLIGFIAATLLLESIDIKLLWLVFAVFIIASALMLLWRFSRENMLWKVGVWAVISGYVATMYLWLEGEISTTWLVTSFIFSYCGLVIDGCWTTANKFIDKLSESQTSENGDAVEEKQTLVTLDPITNLPTYQHAVGYLKTQMKANTDQEFAAIVFKPLNFAQVNKVLGHQNSDILLLQLAYSLQQSLANNQLLFDFSHSDDAIRVCRLQGLDFLVVYNTKSSHHPTKIVVEDICTQLNNSVPKAMSYKSFSLNFELVFGASLSHDGNSNAEKLIGQASDALLEAEHTHQHLCYFDNSTALYTQQQLVKMEKLKRDIVDESLAWVVHPQLSLNNHKIKGMQLTIDWQCSDGSRLTTDEFEQIAEFSGEIYRLTKQMIAKAFGLLSIMHQKGVEQTVAITLSSKDLLEPELVDFVEQQSKNNGIPLSYLVIELNEKVLLTSAYRARVMIDQFKSLGVKVAINNFSGSYESLRYLRKTSVDQVKIECSHLHNETSAKSDKTIVNALVNLTRKMSIPLIATGVNNRDIEKAYIAMGGDTAQGRLLHQGINYDDVDHWLTARLSNQNG